MRARVTFALSVEMALAVPTKDSCRELICSLSLPLSLALSPPLSLAAPSRPQCSHGRQAASLALLAQLARAYG